MIYGYPTESFYALGVPATNAAAIRRLFRVKKREKYKPVALIAADLAQVRKFFDTTKTELRLMKRYWPGALTILLESKAPTSPRPSSGRRGCVAAEALLGFTFPGLPAGQAGATPPRPPPGHPSIIKEGVGGGRIGVRVPAHAGARRLAMMVGVPITATSANISGQPPTKSARKLKHDFPDIMIVPGRCGRQTKPSTVVECQGKNLIIHRSGSVHVS